VGKGREGSQKVKVQGNVSHKHIVCLGLCTLVSAGFQ